MIRRSVLSGYRWLWAPGSAAPVRTAQRRRRLHAGAVLAVVMAIVAIIAQMDVHAPEVLRGPVILALLLTPAIGQAYITIARRLIDISEAAMIVSASGSACITAASARIAEMQPPMQVAIADRARRALVRARVAHRAALDALRAAARVSHVAIAPRMTSRALRAAA